MIRLIVLILIFLMTGCGNRLSSEPANEGLGAHRQIDSSEKPSKPRKLTKAEVLYNRNCATCHGWDGKDGGPGAKILGIYPPSLRREALFSRYSEEGLIARVMFGKVLTGPLNQIENPKAAAEINAILSHMRRLPNIAWDQVSSGEEIYDELCIGCHGVYGRGDGEWASKLPVAPGDLGETLFQDQINDDQLVNIIAEGKGTMPGAADVLNLNELKDVVAFVRLFSPGYEAYDRFCASCHGSDGVPIELIYYDELGFETDRIEIPTFDTAYFESITDEELRTQIKHMLATNRVSMPHFAGDLEKEEVRQILNYLRTLPPES